MNRADRLIKVFGDIVAAMESIIPDVSEKAALTDTRSYPTIRREYRLIVYEAVVGYLDSTGSISRYKNMMSRGIVEHFPQAFYAGCSESGADETDDEDEMWLTERIQAELGFVSSLFMTLKTLRGNVDADEEANSRADGYANTLDGIYSEGRLRCAKNKTLEFDGEDGVENCSTCRGLKGKKRTIKWILENEMIPAPGNKNFICEGYECRHYWKDPKTGKRWTF